MGLLPELLDRVESAAPTEVLLATERPLTLIHARGTQTLEGVIRDGDIYQVLSDLLTPEQQAELVVCRRVEVELASANDRRWRVIAETGTDTISIRAQPDGESDGLDADEVVVIFPTDAWGAGEPPREEAAEIEVDIDVDIEVEDATTRRHAAVPIKLPPGSRTRRRTGALRSLEGEGQAAAVWHDAGVLVSSIRPGSLCFLHFGDDVGSQVARALAQPVLTIGEADTPSMLSSALGALADDGVIVVSIEDPSPWLPWLLRRVEEGRRVVIETRATTHEGARRILLGVDASARAEAWLDALPVTSAALRDGAWSIVA